MLEIVTNGAQGLLIISTLIWWLSNHSVGKADPSQRFCADSPWLSKLARNANVGSRSAYLPSRDGRYRGDNPKCGCLHNSIPAPLPNCAQNIFNPMEQSKPKAQKAQKHIDPQKEICHFCTFISHSASQADDNAQKCSPGSGPPDLQTIWVPVEG